jgi:hypothetical protein
MADRPDLRDPGRDLVGVPMTNEAGEHVHVWVPNIIPNYYGATRLYPDCCSCGAIKRYDGVILPARLS